MKRTIKYMLFAAAMTLGISACVKQAPEYIGGEAEVAGCYGVYFPNQDASGKHAYDPADPTVVTFTAARKNTKGDITVPVTVKDTSAAKVFEVGALTFADGQSESTITVNFPNAVIGTMYALSLSITDENYAAKYNDGSFGIDFSVMREKWNSLGNAAYRDDFVTGFYGVDNVEYAVEIQENDLIKGYYRLVNPYCEAYPYNDPGDWDDSKTWYFYIHAEDPEGVYIPVQEVGMAWGDGAFYMGSIAGFKIAKGETLDSQKDAGNTGINANGVITFPKDKLLVGLSGYKNGALYTCNAKGMERIVLPGAIPVDYSLSLSTDYSKDGNAPIEITAGADVAKIKYAVYEGELSANKVKSKVTFIADGTDKSTEFSDFTYDDETMMNYASLALSFAKSGIYTIVAVGYDKTDAQQLYGFSTFKYVTAEEQDKYKVSAFAGIEDVSKRYEAQGFTDINSIQYYIYGDTLTDVHVMFAKTASYTKDEAAYESEVKNNSKYAVSADILKIINSDGGYAAIQTKLSPLTSYTMLVWATNGNLEKLIVLDRTTDGLPLKQIGTGSYLYNSAWAGTDTGLGLYSDPNYENTYVIQPWCNGSSFKFTKDDKGVIKVALNYSGSDYGGAGDVYIIESADYWSEAYLKANPDAAKESYYDEKTGVYNFHVVYFIDGLGSFGHAWETFTPDASGASVKASSVSTKTTKAGLKRSKYTFSIPATNFRIERDPQPVKATVKTIATKMPKASGKAGKTLKGNNTPFID